MDNAHEPPTRAASYRIAVASRDGEIVTDHFGGCPRFLLVGVDAAGRYQLEGFRDVVPPCLTGAHSAASMADAVEALSDCRIVVARKIGPPAAAALRRRGIAVLEYPGRVEDALRYILGESP